MSTNIAPTIEKGAKTIRKSKGKGKGQKSVTRSALTSPYVVEWPPLPSGVTPDILSEIKRTFLPLQNLLGKRRCKNRKQTERRKAEEETHPERKEEDKTRFALRSQLALGVNEVTRSLEKGQLQLIMVCRSAKPDLMTSHLPTLSVTRGCPALAVFHLSNTLAPFLNMKTVLAIGFKKPSDGENRPEFASLVSFVREKCPVIKVPWLDLKHLPPKELAAALSRDTFSSQKKPGTDADVMGKHQDVKNELTTQNAISKIFQVDAGSSEDMVLKDSQRGREETEQGRRTSIDGGGISRDIASVSDGNAERTTEEAERTIHSEDSPGSSIMAKKVLCQDGTKEDEGAGRQSQATKKRKLSDISTSPGKINAESNRKKTAKMPFQAANVMHVKIIGKELKGKKGKRKKGKQK